MKIRWHWCCNTWVLSCNVLFWWRTLRMETITVSFWPTFCIRFNLRNLSSSYDLVKFSTFVDFLFSLFDSFKSQGSSLSSRTPCSPPNHCYSPTQKEATTLSGQNSMETSASIGSGDQDQAIRRQRNRKAGRPYLERQRCKDASDGYQASVSSDSAWSASTSSSSGSSSFANSVGSKSTVDIGSSQDDRMPEHPKRQDVADQKVADARQNPECPGFPGFPDDASTAPMEHPPDISGGHQQSKTKHHSADEIMSVGENNRRQAKHRDDKHNNKSINSRSNENGANCTHPIVRSTPHRSSCGRQRDVVTDGKPKQSRSQSESRVVTSLLSLARKSSGISFAVQFCLQSKRRPTFDWNAWNLKENQSFERFQHKVGIPLWTVGPRSGPSAGSSSKGFTGRPASKDWYLYDGIIAVVFFILHLCFVTFVLSPLLFPLCSISLVISLLFTHFCYVTFVNYSSVLYDLCYAKVIVWILRFHQRTA